MAPAIPPHMLVAFMFSSAKYSDSGTSKVQDPPDFTEKQFGNCGVMSIPFMLNESIVPKDSLYL